MAMTISTPWRVTSAIVLLDPFAVNSVAVPREGRGERLNGAPRAVPVALLEGVVSCYHGVVTRQTTVRLPDELADQADAVARVRGTSVNALIVESLSTAIDLVRADDDFTERARKLLERDKELLDRLAR